MKIIIDIPKKAYETIKAEKEIDWLGVEYILDCIKNGTPTEEPVVRGKWIYDGSLGYRGESHYKCSICGKRAKEKECNGRLVGGYGPEAIGSEWICDYEPDFTNYCSNCGAKMKESGGRNE